MKCNGVDGRKLEWRKCAAAHHLISYRLDQGALCEFGSDVLSAKARAGRKTSLEYLEYQQLFSVETVAQHPNHILPPTLATIPLQISKMKWLSPNLGVPQTAIFNGGFGNTPDPWRLQRAADSAFHCGSCLHSNSHFEGKSASSFSDSGLSD